MTCQGPMTQLYIREEGKSGLAHRKMSKVPSTHCPASCKRKTNTYLKAKTMPEVYKILPQPTSHSKSSMLSGYQVSPEQDWSLQSGQDPRTKWETIKPNVPSNSNFFLFSHLSLDHKLSPTELFMLVVTLLKVQ